MATSDATSPRTSKAAMAGKVLLGMIVFFAIAGAIIYNQAKIFNMMWPKAISFVLETLTSESNTIICFSVLAFLLLGIPIVVYLVFFRSGSNRGRISEA